MNRREHNLKYKNEHPWARFWRSAYGRVKVRKDRPSRVYKGLPFKITVADVKKLWLRDRAYDMDQPSLDRKVAGKGYVYSNLRFVELSVNLARSRE